MVFLFLIKKTTKYLLCIVVLLNLKFHLKTSRPGLWFPTVWLYVIPTAGLEVLQSPQFWIGLLYFTFPFNYFIYSWNDWADIELDANNPRKNTFLFGAISNHTLRKQILLINLCLQVPFLLFFAYHTGYYIIWWLCTLLFLNYIYNNKNVLISGKPPWELFVSLGYLLALVMSVRVNGNPALPSLTFVYLILFAIQSHLIGEIMDIDPDRAGGRKTTATILGYKNSKIVLAAIAAIEGYLLLRSFNEPFLGGFLFLYALYLLVDSFFIFKNTAYPLPLLKLFGICANIAAIITMVWLWLTGSLV